VWRRGVGVRVGLRGRVLYVVVLEWEGVHRDDGGGGGRPVDAAREKGPGRRDAGYRQAACGKRRDGQGLGRGDAEAQRGREKNEGEGAGS